MAMIVNRSGSTVEGRLHGTVQGTVEGDAVLLDENGKVPASFIPNYNPPVTSVNGETGDVHLDASDVGALPDSTMYVSSVNDKIGTVTLTARDVGALPNDTAIPVVYDAKLTIQRNGYKVAEFTSNASDPVIANIEVPTSASEVGAVASVSAQSIVYATDGSGSATTVGYGTSGNNKLVQTNSSGKLDNSVLPSLAIGEYKGEVTTKANLVTLTTAEKGDIAKVTSDTTVNNNGVYWLNGTYSTLADWVQIVGSGSVISVNGQTGVVSLSASDVSALSSSTVFATINGTSVKSNTPFSLQTPLTAGVDYQTPLTAGTDYQVPLVGSGDGQNIKTINDDSVLGSGNIALQTPLTAGVDYQTPISAGTDYVAHSDSASKVYGTNSSKADTTYSLDTGTVSSSSTDAQIPTSLTVYEGLSGKQNNLTFTDVSITESD